MAKETPASVFGDDPATMEALAEITGYDVVRVQTGEKEDGKAIFAPGYKIASNGEYAFRNEIGQSCHVPGHRVDELLKAKTPPEKKPAK